MNGEHTKWLLTLTPSQLLHKLQVIQNAAARLVTGARRSEHMTPVLPDLHWLLVRQWISFKFAVLMYQCQHGMAPQYLQRIASQRSAARNFDLHTLVY